MDREIDARTRTRRQLKRYGLAGSTLVLAIAILAFSISWLRPSLRRADLRIARVEEGAFLSTLEGTGTVVPAFEKVLSTPVDARVVGLMLRPGTLVSSGAEIVRLDTSAVGLDLNRLEERIAQKMSERSQVAMRLEESAASLRSQLEQKKLDAEILGYRLQQIKTLRSEGLMSEEAFRQADVSAKKAQIELSQIQASLATGQRSGAAQLSAVEADLRLLHQERTATRRKLDLASIRADRDGVVTWVTPEEGAMLRSGEVVARIADLSSFRVEATASDIHASRVAPGLQAKVRIGDVSLDGMVVNVDPTVRSGVVRFTVELADKSNRLLRNSLRVDVALITGRRDRALKVPAGPFYKAPQQDVFVVRGERALRVPARFGLAGSDEIEVLSGLAAGDEVIVSDMSDWTHLKQIRLR